MTLFGPCRPLIVGEMPGVNTSWRYPMFPYPPNSAGGRFQRMLGLTRGQYLRRFDRCNLIREYRRRWPRELAEAAADVLVQSRAGGLLILLGDRVRRAFIRDEGYLEWFRGVRLPSRDGGERVLTVQVPHPSGRNRLWNDEGNHERLRRLIRDAAPGVLEAA